MADPEGLGGLRTVDAALAGDLRAVGVCDRRDLAVVGATGAWDRLYARDLRDDLGTLLSLEAAAQGRRLRSLPAEDRERLAAHVRRRTAGPDRGL